jgi:hypothetical protein
MKNSDTDGKDINGTDHPKATEACDSLKRPWQTPEIIEEDYQETKVSGVVSAGTDGILYS